MIQPIIAAQVSTPAAAIQHNTEAQGFLHNQNAVHQVKEEQRQIRESVVNKDEAVFYEQRHDAKEEGRNKYENLYTNKKKKDSGNSESAKEQTINRVNFDIKI
ncbi:MAG: hypothetical protein E7259_03385 [Lachnospiraceae bacterium]|nr:hypothetical protein [Lachnospiraceae bacterium]